MPDCAIDIEDVSKRFGSTQSLDGLKLRVPSGSVFGLLGPNGAGKTTTLRVLLGLVRPDRGQVSVLGLDPLDDSRRIRERVGVLLEHDGLYERLSALQNLDYHARIQHLDAATRFRRIEELLRSFELWERRYEPVIRWSKGMRQKLAVARALLHRPRLLLLDEPFSGLDPAAAVELRERIARLAREETVTLVLATHDLAHVEKSCGEVAMMCEGRLIAAGKPNSLRMNATELTVEVAGEGLGDGVLSEMKRAGIIVSYDLEGETARLSCPPARRKRLASELAQRGVILEELHTVHSTLEETFLALMASSAKEGGS